MSYLFHFFGKNCKVLGICGIYGYIKSVPGSTNRGAQDKLFPYAASAVASWVETAELAEVARDYEKQCKEVGFWCQKWVKVARGSVFAKSLWFFSGKGGFGYQNGPFWQGKR